MLTRMTRMTEASSGMKHNTSPQTLISFHIWRIAVAVLLAGYQCSQQQVTVVNNQNINIKASIIYIRQ